MPCCKGMRPSPTAEISRAAFSPHPSPFTPQVAGGDGADDGAPLRWHCGAACGVVHNATSGPGGRSVAAAAAAAAAALRAGGVTTLLFWGDSVIDAQFVAAMRFFGARDGFSRGRPVAVRPPIDGAPVLVYQAGRPAFPFPFPLSLLIETRRLVCDRV